MSKFKLVPVEPTPDMFLAAQAAQMDHSDHDDWLADYAADVGRMYKSMLEAAPDQPVKESVVAKRIPIAYAIDPTNGREIEYRNLYTAPPDTEALLRQALERLEESLERIEGEWGKGRNLDELESDNDLWPEIVAIRKHLGAA